MLIARYPSWFVFTALLLLSMLVCVAGSGSAQQDDVATIRRSIQDLVLDDKYAEAERHARRWLELAERRGDQSIEVAEALEWLTRIYAGLRRYDDAENVWRRCLELRVKALGSKHALISKTIDLMTGIYIDQGRTKEAQVLWRDGLAAFQSRPAVPAIKGSPPSDATARHVPDSIARGHFGDAEKTLRDRNDLPGLAAFLIERGRHDEAVAIHRRLFDSAPTGERGINIAALYRQRGLLEHEQEFLRRAVAAQEQTLGPEHQDLIESLATLASSFEKQNRISEAYDARKRASAIVARTQNRQAFIVQALGAAQLRQPHLEFLRIASRLIRDRPERASAITSETFEAGQLATATVLNTTLSQMGARLSQGTGNLAKLARRRQDAEREWQRLDKLLVAAVAGGGLGKDVLRTQIVTVERELSAADDELRRNFPQYFNFSLPTPLKLSDAQQVLRTSEALVQFAIIGEQSYVWVVTKSSAKWAPIAQTPTEVQASVAALRCGLDYPGAWKLSRCAQVVGRNYTKADQAALKPLPFDLDLAYHLYRALFSPVEELIGGKHLLIVPSGALSSLPLHTLVTQKPRTSMPSDWAGYARAPWLAKTHNITILPSIASLRTFRALANQSAGSDPYIAFANPLFASGARAENAALQRRTCVDARPALQTGAIEASLDAPTAHYFRGELANVASVSGMASLFETTDEVCSVARTLGAPPRDVFLADKATERTIKALNKSGQLENYRIVHFATHGLLASETEILAGGPAEPALVLTPPPVASMEDDGLLTASEIAQLKLNAEWVVLSACNTAAGGKTDAEALSGLARSFFYAGARALLVSHWYVNSTATVLLVTGTFDEIRASPAIGRAEALRRAMLKLIVRENEPSAHPAYWAPFVLVGEGAPQ